MDWVVIQSRMGSKRFPGKCKKMIKGKFLIQAVYDRCKLACDNVLVAIPDNEYQYENLLDREMIPFFKGHPTDLIDRYLKAAREHKMDRIVRITGDCPFIPPEYISHSLRLKGDFVSNCILPCVDGFEVEVMSIKCLRWLYRYAPPGHHREHVTSYLKQNLEQSELEVCSWSPSLDISIFPKLSIDTPGDLDRCRKYNIGEELC